MKCVKCDAKIPEDSIFCPNCGNSINVEKSTAQPKKSLVYWAKSFKLSLKGVLLIIAVGIWMLVLQNLGIIPITHDVYVRNGTVDIKWTVDIDSPIDVNLQYINGRADVFFNNPSRGDNDKYYLIPVTVE